MVACPLLYKHKLYFSWLSFSLLCGDPLVVVAFVCLFFVCLLCFVLIVPCGKFGSPYLGDLSFGVRDGRWSLSVLSKGSPFEYNTNQQKGINDTKHKTEATTDVDRIFSHTKRYRYCPCAREIGCIRSQNNAVFVFVFCCCLLCVYFCCWVFVLFVCFVLFFLGFFLYVCLCMCARVCVFSRACVYVCFACFCCFLYQHWNRDGKLKTKQKS